VGRQGLGEKSQGKLAPSNQHGKHGHRQELPPQCNQCFPPCDVNSRLDVDSATGYTHHRSVTHHFHMQFRETKQQVEDLRRKVTAMTILTAKLQ
jgi:hypothetical protein